MTRSKVSSIAPVIIILSSYQNNYYYLPSILFGEIDSSRGRSFVGSISSELRLKILTQTLRRNSSVILV